MSSIPTAEEYLNELVPIGSLSFECGIEAMVEFAKLHVQAALEAASKVPLLEYNVEYNESLFTKPESDTEGILNAYPLTNIK